MVSVSFVTIYIYFHDCFCCKNDAFHVTFSFQLPEFEFYLKNMTNMNQIDKIL